MTTTDWNPLLRSVFAEQWWQDLQAFVAEERKHHTVYPPVEEVFAAFHLTSFAEVKVVILGQDPYHGPGQAHGLCFSVRRGVRFPPSLANIFKELHEDMGVPVPKDGDLTPWARQGVLLLNSTLTVRSGQAGAHTKHGWERFTDLVISTISQRHEPVVFVLWGAYARRKKDLIDTTRHVVIESAHPSPLSAHNGFFGSKPFSAVNAALGSLGQSAINWSLE